MDKDEIFEFLRDNLSLGRDKQGNLCLELCNPETREVIRFTDDGKSKTIQPRYDRRHSWCPEEDE